jgi:hypothetical protein
MASQLKAELVLEAKQAIAGLKSFVAEAEKTGAGGGTSAGASFGNSLKAGILGAIGGFSLAGFFGQISSSVGAYQNVQVANLGLSGAIKATNSRIAEQSKVLGSSTASIEQKALALGIDTTKLYENAKATNTAQNASAGFETTLKNQTRAFEDTIEPLNQSVRGKEKEITLIDKQTEGINKQISALKKQSEEKIKALSKSLGGDDLTAEKSKLEVQKNNLEIKRDTAKIGGDPIAAKFAQIEIDLLSSSISLNQNKLDNIKFQTDALKEQEQVGINNLQNQKDSLALQRQEVQDTIKDLKAQIEGNKIKFDIDIEPLKRKIEDIKQSAQNAGSGGGGGGKVLNQDLAKQIEDASNKSLKLAPELTIDPAKIDKVTGNLLNKFGRTLSKGDITGVLGELIQGGISDAGQLEQLVERFVETSAKSRVGVVNQGEALKNLAQGFKTGNSAITENSGLSENFASNIIPKGTNALIAQALAAGDNAKASRLRAGNLTDEETAQAKLNGILAVTNDTTGNYTDALKQGLLVQSEFNQTQQKTSEGFGKELLPGFNLVINGANNLLKGFNDLLNTTPGLGLALTIFAGTLALVATGFGIVSLVSLPVIGTIALIGLGIVATGLLITGLFVAWNTNFLGIQDIVKSTFDAIGGFYNTNLKPTIDSIVKLFLDTVNNITKYFTDGNITWQEKLGALLGFFISLPFKVTGFVAETVGNITKAFFGLNWGEIGDNMVNGIGNALKSLGNAITNFDFSGLFKGLGNGFMDIWRGIIKGIGAGIPGSDLVINPILKNIPKFATGGLVRGAGTGTSDSITAQLSNGEFVVNEKMTERYLPELRAMNAGAYQTNNNQSYDQSVTQNYHNYSSGGFGFGINQAFRVG